MPMAAAKPTSSVSASVPGALRRKQRRGNQELSQRKRNAERLCEEIWQPEIMQRTSGPGKIGELGRARDKEYRRQKNARC